VLAVASVLSFWHNVLMQSQGWFNYCLNIYWSLSVEEVFYLALPVSCLILRRKWLMVLACLALIIYAPIYRVHASMPLLLVTLRPFLRSDGRLSGDLLASCDSVLHLASA
jgi:peptidoglycan/LPS O-acetylase OafA/YrhL